MEFTQLNSIRSKLPTMFDMMSNEIGDELYKSIQKQFVKETTPTQLAVRTGKLLNSFKPGDPNNTFDVKKTTNNLNITYSSKLPYAQFHEKGGTINSKGKMHKFFWAMYYKFKDNKYKWMAISVKQKGYVEIPARPFIDKARLDFEQNKLPSIIQKYIKILWQ